MFMEWTKMQTRERETKVQRKSEPLLWLTLTQHELGHESLTQETERRRETHIGKEITHDKQKRTH